MLGIPIHDIPEKEKLQDSEKDQCLLAGGEAGGMNSQSRVLENTVSGTALQWWVQVLVQSSMLTECATPGVRVNENQGLECQHVTTEVTKHHNAEPSMVFTQGRQGRGRWEISVPSLNFAVNSK